MSYAYRTTRFTATSEAARLAHAAEFQAIAGGFISSYDSRRGRAPPSAAILA